MNIHTILQLFFGAVWGMMGLFQKPMNLDYIILAYCCFLVAATFRIIDLLEKKDGNSNN